MSFRWLFSPRTLPQRLARAVWLRLQPHWRLQRQRGESVTPFWITTLGSAFWASRVLMTALDLRVFTILSASRMPANELTEALGLHRRSALDFLDALVSLGLLNRTVKGYSNTADSAAFLDERSDLFVGDAIKMANMRLYSYWQQLTDAISTGRPQNELDGEGDQFEAIYADPERLKSFAAAMTAVSRGPAMRLAAEDWSHRHCVADIGTAEGIVLAKIASAHRHLNVVGVDLPQLEPYFTRTMHDHGITSATFTAADVFRDPWPASDVYILGHLLHNFGLEERRALLRSAFEGLPSGGAVFVYDAMIDEHRRTNTVGLLMSLNMLIETPRGSDYSVTEIALLLKNVGFHSIDVHPLFGFDWLARGTKP